MPAPFHIALYASRGNEPISVGFIPYASEKR